MNHYARLLAIRGSLELTLSDVKAMMAELAQPTPEPAPTEPPWMAVARRELGTAEVLGPGNNPRIVEYHRATQLGASDDSVAWCSAFVNWVMQEVGLEGTNSPAARSWMRWGDPLLDPVPGCIAVFWRGSRDGWQGHVGFYVRDLDGDNVEVLGGNQSDKVCVAPQSKARLLGYRWPKGVPIPTN